MWYLPSEPLNGYVGVLSERTVTAVKASGTLMASIDPPPFAAVVADAVPAAAVDTSAVVRPGGVEVLVPESELQAAAASSTAAVASPRSAETGFCYAYCLHRLVRHRRRVTRW